METDFGATIKPFTVSTTMLPLLMLMNAAHVIAPTVIAAAANVDTCTVVKRIMQ
jgi:hypothetical protein